LPKKESEIIFLFNHNKKEELMISDIIKSKMIAEILEGLINGGTENFAPVLEKLLNELMKIEREKCIGA
jgi:phosphosulfolactate phosphohydrolase-like enzyme